MLGQLPVPTPTLHSLPPYPRKVEGPRFPSQNKTETQDTSRCSGFYWRVCGYTPQQGSPPHTPAAKLDTQRTWARLCFLYSSARLFSRSPTKARSRVVRKVTAEGWELAGPSSVSHGHCRQLDAHGRPLEHKGCEPHSGSQIGWLGAKGRAGRRTRPPYQGCTHSVL